MREIALDTETTGLDPNDGHRVVEIGCVELINHVATGRTYHQYLNPERDMPEQAFAVHGLSEEFLSGHPLFADVADAFLEFIGDSPLVIHNAAFDMGFLNAELKLVGRAALDDERAIDTVNLARRKFPGARANLDALCQRFNIDISHRDLHGALKDAQLLAEVYLELAGGRQHGLELVDDKVAVSEGPVADRTFREPRAHAPSADEEARHAAFMEKLSDPIWKRGSPAAGE